jgi:hypothetical protein
MKKNNNVIDAEAKATHAERRFYIWQTTLESGMRVTYGDCQQAVKAANSALAAFDAAFGDGPALTAGTFWSGTYTVGGPANIDIITGGTTETPNPPVRLPNFSPQTPKAGHRASGGLQFTEAEVMGSLTATQTNILAEIKRHPGLRSEQIAKNLGLKPKDVSKVLKALREEKRVSVKGKRRGTMYTAR